ncbi:MAG: sulfurtransferase complex subunit TusB [Novosphingobium sp.]
MAMLHTVNKSPFEKRSLDGALTHAANGAAVLMIEDAVFGALKGTAVTAKVQKALGNLKVYVLGPDLKARGMTEEQVIDGVTVVDYAGFVDLVTEYDKVQAWL